MRPGTSFRSHSAAAASPAADTLSTVSAGAEQATPPTALGKSSRKRKAPPLDVAADGEYVWPLGVVAGEPPAENGVREACEIAVGSPGDHPAVQQFLSSVFHAPSRDEFSASLEDPFYEPCDRVLLKRGSALLGHAHLASRVVRFGGEDLPATALYRLAVLPEHRLRGYGRKLLERTDDRMQQDGSVLGVLSTRAPHFFRRADWVVCMRHSHATVGARDLLAQLSSRGFSPPEIDDELNIRPWRHVELPSLVRLYDECTKQAYGPYQRTEAYWRWLVGRQAAENIFVALAGPQRFDFDFHDASIVGYVVVKDDRILELVASRRHPGVAERLLARACGEAIEHDHHVVNLHLAPDDPLWNVVESSEATQHRSEAYQGEVSMVKLFDQPAFLERLLPRLHERAAAAELKRPTELGLAVEEWRGRLAVSRRGVRLMRTTPGKHWLRLSKADFTRLLLGHLDLGEAETAGRVKASSHAVLSTAAALFPKLPLWRPPLDDLLV